jgi:hypothetical protein
MPAPTTQTSARVFLSSADDRMTEEVATQTEAVLRRLDRRFPAVLFFEGRLEVFFVIILIRLRGAPHIAPPWSSKQLCTVCPVYGNKRCVKTSAMGGDMTTVSSTEITIRARAQLVFQLEFEAV